MLDHHPGAKAYRHLVTVNVKVEVFFRHFVIGTVFADFPQRFVERGLQLGIVFAQANPGTVTEEVFIFYRRTGEGELFPGRLFKEAFAGGNLILQGGVQTTGGKVRVDQMPLLRQLALPKAS